MTQFLHLPSDTVLTAETPYQLRRYRRSANFVEVTDTKPRLPDVPEGTISEILEWAGTDQARITAAWFAEKAGKNRKTLLSTLESLT